MTIDKEKLRVLAQTVIDIADPWYTDEQLILRAVDPEAAALMAEATPEVIQGLLDEIARLEAAIELHAGYHAKADAYDQLKAASESLRKDWTKASVEQYGFEYVRESDDHYVVASPSEMVALLRDLVGLDVRQKDSSSYGESVRELKQQLDSVTDWAHSLRKDAERYRWLTYDNLSSVALDSVFDHFGVPVGALIDAAMAKEKPE